MSGGRASHECIQRYKEVFLSSDANRRISPAGGPTKDEILAISLFKLDPMADDVCADLGCGTGKVSLALSGCARIVYAVDRRREAYEWTKHEAEAGGISNIIAHHTDAVSFLSGIFHLDCAFIGGTRDLSEIITHLHRLAIRRVVINAVLLSSVNTALETLKQYDMFDEIVHVQVSRSHSIGDGLMLRPIDPVFIITGGCF